MTEKQTPYMASNFERQPDDFYPTIDARCVDGLLHFLQANIDSVVDVCAPSGSGIVDRLKYCRVMAWGVGDAFCDHSDLAYRRAPDYELYPRWIVTNPPYELSKVDKIIQRQIRRVENREVLGAAFLMRNNFDHAAKRHTMFSHPAYMGQIKLCFRPWWTESREHTPFHSYTWQIFRYDGRLFDPIVLHYYPPYEKRYAADVHNFKCRKCGKKDRVKYTSQDLVSVCVNCLDPEYSIEALGKTETATINASPTGGKES